MGSQAHLTTAGASDRFDAEVRVRQVRYTAPEEDFAVLVVEGSDGDPVSAAGPLSHLADGDRVRLIGHWHDHARYGRQVRADVAYELDPDDTDGVLGYLTTVERIGKRRARQLVNRHGAKVFSVIDADPEAVFHALPRMSRRAAVAAAESWRERRALRELYVLLAPHGAGWLAGPLNERHGAEAVALVRADPYRLAEHHGVGFRTADAVARAQAVATDSPSRYKAAAIHLLHSAESSGHTYLPAGELRRAAEPLIGELSASMLAEIGSEGAVVLVDQSVALPGTWRAEQSLAEHLAALAKARPVIRAPRRARMDQELTEEQRAAVEAAFERRLSVVTGGPGTGKTTLVRTIVELAKQRQLALALSAPTGRAARRLEEATGHAATTIHRLLEWLPGEGPLRGPGDPVDCDMLVVDESSMLSLRVAHTLFEALDERTHVVLVGDADQLPPVGAGKPFADVIEAGRIPVTKLTHVFRQAARSMIVSAAHAINNGRRPPTKAAEGQLRDFFVMERQSDAEAAATVIELAAGRLARHYDIDPVRDVQVLSPIYRGPLGIDMLNRRIRAELNPAGELLLDGGVRAGDKLIQTRNDYDTGLMNGQLMIAIGVDSANSGLVVDVDDGRRITIPATAGRWLRPAYAISVHRSQGCEMPVVVLPVHLAHSMMLSRNLLYTAITRAQTACVLVGQPEALARAARRTDSFRRHTRLARLVRELT